MIHALIVLVLCVPLWFLPFDLALFGAGALGGFYVGREIAQAEYRYIEAYCDRKRANMPWWAVLTPKAWTLKGMLDWLLPVIVSVGFVVARKLAA